MELGTASVTVIAALSLLVPLLVRRRQRRLEEALGLADELVEHALRRALLARQRLPL